VLLILYFIDVDLIVSVVELNFNL